MDPAPAAASSSAAAEQQQQQESLPDLRDWFNVPDVVRESILVLEQQQGVHADAISHIAKQVKAVKTMHKKCCHPTAETAATTTNPPPPATRTLFPPTSSAGAAEASSNNVAPPPPPPPATLVNRDSRSSSTTSQQHQQQQQQHQESQQHQTFSDLEKRMRNVELSLRHFQDKTSTLTVTSPPPPPAAVANTSTTAATANDAQQQQQHHHQMIRSVVNSVLAERAIEQRQRHFEATVAVLCALLDDDDTGARIAQVHVPVATESRIQIRKFISTMVASEVDERRQQMEATTAHDDNSSLLEFAEKSAETTQRLFEELDRVRQRQADSEAKLLEKISHKSDSNNSTSVVTLLQETCNKLGKQMTDIEAAVDSSRESWLVQYNKVQQQLRGADSRASVASQHQVNDLERRLEVQIAEVLQQQRVQLAEVQDEVARVRGATVANAMVEKSVADEQATAVSSLRSKTFDLANRVDMLDKLIKNNTGAAVAAGGGAGAEYTLVLMERQHEQNRQQQELQRAVTKLESMTGEMLSVQHEHSKTIGGIMTRVSDLSSTSGEMKRKQEQHAEQLASTSPARAWQQEQVRIMGANSGNNSNNNSPQRNSNNDDLLSQFMSFKNAIYEDLRELRTNVQQISTARPLVTVTNSPPHHGSVAAGADGGSSQQHHPATTFAPPFGHQQHHQTETSSSSSPPQLVVNAAFEQLREKSQENAQLSKGLSARVEKSEGDLNQVKQLVATAQQIATEAKQTVHGVTQSVRDDVAELRRKVDDANKKLEGNNEAILLRLNQQQQDIISSGNNNNDKNASLSAELRSAIDQHENKLKEHTALISETKQSLQTQLQQQQQQMLQQQQQILKEQQEQEHKERAIKQAEQDLKNLESHILSAQKEASAELTTRFETFFKASAEKEAERERQQREREQQEEQKRREEQQAAHETSMSLEFLAHSNRIGELEEAMDRLLAWSRSVDERSEGVSAQCVDLEEASIRREQRVQADCLNKTEDVQKTLRDAISAVAERIQMVECLVGRSGGDDVPIPDLSALQFSSGGGGGFATMTSSYHHHHQQQRQQQQHNNTTSTPLSPGGQQNTNQQDSADRINMLAASLHQLANQHMTLQLTVERQQQQQQQQPQARGNSNSVNASVTSLMTDEQQLEADSASIRSLAIKIAADPIARHELQVSLVSPDAVSNVLPSVQPPTWVAHTAHQRFTELWADRATTLEKRLRDNMRGEWEGAISKEARDIKAEVDDKLRLHHTELNRAMTTVAENAVAAERTAMMQQAALLSQTQNKPMPSSALQRETSPPPLPNSGAPPTPMVSSHHNNPNQQQQQVGPSEAEVKDMIQAQIRDRVETELITPLRSEMHSWVADTLETIQQKQQGASEHQKQFNADIKTEVANLGNRINSNNDDINNSVKLALQNVGDRHQKLQHDLSDLSMQVASNSANVHSLVDAQVDTKMEKFHRDVVDPSTKRVCEKLAARIDEQQANQDALQKVVGEQFQGLDTILEDIRVGKSGKEEAMARERLLNSVERRCSAAESHISEETRALAEDMVSLRARFDKLSVEFVDSVSDLKRQQRQALANMTAEQQHQQQLLDESITHQNSVLSSSTARINQQMQQQQQTDVSNHNNNENNTNSNTSTAQQMKQQMMEKQQSSYVSATHAINFLPPDPSREERMLQQLQDAITSDVQVHVDRILMQQLARKANSDSVVQRDEVSSIVVKIAESILTPMLAGPIKKDVDALWKEVERIWTEFDRILGVSDAVDAVLAHQHNISGRGGGVKAKNNNNSQRKRRQQQQRQQMASEEEQEEEEEEYDDHDDYDDDDGLQAPAMSSVEPSIDHVEEHTNDSSADDAVVRHLNSATAGAAATATGRRSVAVSVEKKRGVVVNTGADSQHNLPPLAPSAQQQQPPVRHISLLSRQ